MRKRSGEEGQSVKKRTLRQIQRKGAAEPCFIKNTYEVNVGQTSMPPTEATPPRKGESSERLTDSSTTLDRILTKLRTRKWPKSIVLLITPSSRHATQYKLHIIDRKRNEHLGVTNITQSELFEIKSSKAYQRFNIIFGTKCIDLKTVALQTALIGELMGSLDCNNCCPNKCMMKSAAVENGRFEIDNESTTNTESQPVQPPWRAAEQQGAQQQQRQLLQRELVEAEQKEREQKQPVTKQQQPYEQQCLDFKLNKTTVTDDHLHALIDRINNAFEPSAKDLDKFFTLAERYNFAMFVRPAVYWHPSFNASLTKEQDQPVRFSVECFMQFDNYVGSISLYSEQLEQWLRKHATLLPRVSVISDIFELTPIPKVLVTVLRTFCRWLCMEMLYDTLGELVFNFCKQFA